MSIDATSRAYLDEDGYYTGVVVLAFANVTSTSLGATAPVEATDFLKPEFKGKLIFTFYSAANWSCSADFGVGVLARPVPVAAKA